MNFLQVRHTRTTSPSVRPVRGPARTRISGWSRRACSCTSFKGTRTSRSLIRSWTSSGQPLDVGPLVYGLNVTENQELSSATVAVLPFDAYFGSRQSDMERALAFEEALIKSEFYCSYKWSFRGKINAVFFRWWNDKSGKYLGIHFVPHSEAAVSGKKPMG